jgi:hypothetical protein
LDVDPQRGAGRWNVSPVLLELVPGAGSSAVEDVEAERDDDVPGEVWAPSAEAVAPTRRRAADEARTRRFLCMIDSISL